MKMLIYIFASLHLVSPPLYCQSYEEHWSTLRKISDPIDQAKYVASMAQGPISSGGVKMLIDCLGMTPRSRWEVGGDIQAFHKADDPSVIALCSIPDPPVLSESALGQKRHLYQIECMAYILHVKHGPEKALRLAEEYAKSQSLSQECRENLALLVSYLTNPKLGESGRLSDEVKGQSNGSAQPTPAASSSQPAGPLSSSTTNEPASTKPVRISPSPGTRWLSNNLNQTTLWIGVAVSVALGAIFLYRHNQGK